MRIWPAFIVCLALTGCGSKGSVSLTVYSSNEALTVQTSPFGGGVIDGVFQLQFVVGGEASGGSDVTLGNFSLQTDTGASLVDVLDVESSTVFPLHVDKGGSQRVSFKMKANVADPAPVCAGSILLVGTVDDSLTGNSQPVRSLPITPNCP